MSQTTGDSTTGQRGAIIAGLLGLIPVLGLGVLSFFNQERPEVREQLAGNVVFVLILASPYLLALVAARISNPAKRGGLLLALGILSLATVFYSLSGVTVILLPATVALFIAAVRSLRSADGQVVWALPFLIPGLLGAAAIGFGFYALFGLQADEPRCWVLTVVEGKEEWQTLAVPTPNKPGSVTMGPFGPEVRRSFCTSDIITGQEGAGGLASLAAGVLVLVTASQIIEKFIRRDDSR